MMGTLWTRWDRGLLASAIGLVLIGAIAMASAAATLNPLLAVRHAVWIAIGILASVGIAQTNYRRWTDAAWLAYGLSLLVLMLVHLAGDVRLGAARWLSLFGFSVQPSEMAKLTTIWLLARYFAGTSTPQSLRAVLTSLLLVGPPTLLILTQPDLGSASVFGAIWVGMMWVAGASGRIFAGLAVVVAALVPIGWHFLHGYQRERLAVFLNPHADPLGAGYTIIQSTIAIGSGRVWGRGWFAGTQNQLSFLPERHSDFIFSVIGEEWGFLGCLAIVGLFILLVARASRIAQRTSDLQGRLLAAGILSWLGYQAFVNMGMVMGLLPVVGVPLPLLSYGGSSMLSVWVALGLLQSIHRSSERQM